jgi:hypothetical protein
MKCEQAEEYVDEYIKHTLPERTQVEFINHVKSCPQCFRELETYFIVDVAMKYFDDDKEDNYDISNILQADLDQRLRKYNHKKRMNRVLISLSILLVVLIIWLWIYWFN